MTPAAPQDSPDDPPPDPNELIQMNVRVPRWLRDAVDERRDRVRDGQGKALSRDRWVTRALSFALKQPGNPVRRRGTVARTSRGRTINPGGTR